MTFMLLNEAPLLERPTLAIMPQAHESHWFHNNIGGVKSVTHSRFQLLRHPHEVKARKNGPAVDRSFPAGALGFLVKTCANTTE
jgi:hypothetical protein